MGMGTIMAENTATELAVGLLQAGLGKDSVAIIEDTVKQFFHAYNLQSYDGCLAHVMQRSAGDKSRLTALLLVARHFTGVMTVESVADIRVDGSTATVRLRAAIHGEASEEKVKLVRDGNCWKLDWDASAGPLLMVAAQLKA